MRKVRVAIIGSGNIGTDLMVKALRSKWIEPVWMVGIDPESDGLAKANAAGLKTTDKGLDGLLPYLERDGIEIAFDATSARVHMSNAPKLQERSVLAIDLTPAAVGPFCVPAVNLEEHMDRQAMNVNMVTCGAQATVPIVAAVSAVQTVQYGEIVATVASKSAGPGTRQNIDEFTRTTARAVEQVGGAQKGKAIIILNPAEPPLIMRDTIHCITCEEPDRDGITKSVNDMVAEVQKYVPGYRLKNGPTFDGCQVSIFIEVEGLGDYLPKYAGNLDVMTAAALRTGEMLAEAISEGRLSLQSSIPTLSETI